MENFRLYEVKLGMKLPVHILAIPEDQDVQAYMDKLVTQIQKSVVYRELPDEKAPEKFSVCLLPTDMALSWEYWCPGCGKMRLSFRARPAHCEGCGSKDIKIGSPGDL